MVLFLLPTWICVNGANGPQIRFCVLLKVALLTALWDAREAWVGHRSNIHPKQKNAKLQQKWIAHHPAGSASSCLNLGWVHGLSPEIFQLRSFPSQEAVVNAPMQSTGCRSVAGRGVRQTQEISSSLTEMQIPNVPLADLGTSRHSCFDNAILGHCIVRLSTKSSARMAKMNSNCEFVHVQFQPSCAAAVARGALVEWRIALGGPRESRHLHMETWGRKWDRSNVCTLRSWPGNETWATLFKDSISWFVYIISTSS